VTADGRATSKQQTWDRHQRCYFLRIVPIAPGKEPGSDGRAAGPAARRVVLTLTDISRSNRPGAGAQLSRSSSRPTTRSSARRSTAHHHLEHGASALYGYAAGEAIGRHASFLYPPGRKEESTSFCSRSARPARRAARDHAPAQGWQRRRRLGHLLADSRVRNASSGFPDLARHHAAGPRAPGNRRPRGAHPPAARFHRRSDSTAST
jgi:hypothetical protein